MVFHLGVGSANEQKRSVGCGCSVRDLCSSIYRIAPAHLLEMVQERRMVRLMISAAGT